MTTYRDTLVERFGTEVGSVVGCALDRLNRKVMQFEIDAAVAFYQSHSNAINTFPIGARRDLIHNFIENGKSPEFLVANGS